MLLIESPPLLYEYRPLCYMSHRLNALAFETIGVLTKVPNGIYYADLKPDPCLEPIRKDPRYVKLLAELAPKD